MSHVHKYTKHIALEDEQLPDSTGALVTYVGAPKADFEVTERFGGPSSTVEAGQIFAAPDGASGTVVDQSSDFKYGWHMSGGGNDGGPYIETVTKARVDLGAGVTSF